MNKKGDKSISYMVGFVIAIIVILLVGVLIFPGFMHKISDFFKKITNDAGDKFGMKFFDDKEDGTSEESDEPGSENGGDKEPTVKSVADVNIDPVGLSNTGLLPGRKVQAQYGEYIVRPTFTEYGGEINYKYYNLYITGPGIEDPGCTLNFRRGDKSGKCGDLLVVNILKEPTEENPEVEFDLIEKYTPLGVVLKPDKEYKIPRSVKEFYVVDIAGQKFEMGYHREVPDGLRFVVKRTGTDDGCEIDKVGDTYKGLSILSAPPVCRDCDKSTATFEFQVKPDKECCYDKHSAMLCARVTEKTNDYVTIEILSAGK